MTSHDALFPPTIPRVPHKALAWIPFDKRNSDLIYTLELFAEARLDSF